MKIAEKTAREFFEARWMQMKERQEMSDEFWRRIGEWLEKENTPWPGVKTLNPKQERQ